MADEFEIRQVCPHCGAVDAEAGWRGEAESIEVGYLGPAGDGVALGGGPRSVDVHAPCAACLEHCGQG